MSHHHHATDLTLKELCTFRGPTKVLHMTWFAFFLTFVAWFNMAPLATTMQAQLGLTAAQLKILAICNVALTIPARILIGMLLDAYGPRKVYSALLVVMSIPCFIFAMGSTFTQLVISRLLLGMIGAGFVIGIRMVSEWFPPKKVGFAEGIYGGWGNFGSAAAAFTLPVIALNLFGGANGWRYAIILTGLACLIFGFIYYKSVTDTPQGKIYSKPKKHGAMEVTSWSGLISSMLLFLPLFAALGILTWKLQMIGFLGNGIATAIYLGLGLLYAYKCSKIYRVNAPAIKQGYPPEDQYDYRQVVVLSLAYLVTFGSELAVVSMLPAFFQETWSLSPQAAGMIAASYAFMNLFSRPIGGLMSDGFGSRKKTLFFLLAGLGGGYFMMSRLDASWPVTVAIIVTMVCSFFVQAGEGAVFAMVPLVKKRITGQVAGMVGAYGNVGAVLFLTVFSFVSPSVFFMVIAAFALISMVACFWISEPEGSFADGYKDEILGTPTEIKQGAAA